MYSQSILNGAKIECGVSPEYAPFDDAIIGHVNSVFLILARIGVGPDAPYHIEDASATWPDFFADSPDAEMAHAVVSFMYLSVQLLFDPPTVAALLEAKKQQKDEFEFSLLIWSAKKKREAVSA